MFMSNEELNRQLDLCNELEEVESSIDEQEHRDVDYKSDNILEIGNVYGIRLESIRHINICTNTEISSLFDYYYGLTSCANCGSEINDLCSKVEHKYTLLKYLGYDRFEEFYTGTIIKGFDSTKMDLRKFLKGYSEYIENPLCISRNSLLEFNLDIKNKIINNTNNEEDIIEYLDQYRKASTEVLEKEYYDLANKDIDYAKTEDAIYDFKNKKVKKIIQI